MNTFVHIVHLKFDAHMNKIIINLYNFRVLIKNIYIYMKNLYNNLSILKKKLQNILQLRIQKQLDGQMLIDIMM